MVKYVCLHFINIRHVHLRGHIGNRLLVYDEPSVYFLQLHLAFTVKTCITGPFTCFHINVVNVFKFTSRNVHLNVTTFNCTGMSESNLDTSREATYCFKAC